MNLDLCDGSVYDSEHDHMEININNTPGYIAAVDGDFSYQPVKLIVDLYQPY